MIKLLLPPWLDAEKKSRARPAESCPDIRRWRRETFSFQWSKIFKLVEVATRNTLHQWFFRMIETSRLLMVFWFGTRDEEKPKELKLWIKQRTFLDGELLLCCSFCNIDENIVSCSRLVLPCSTIPKARRLKIRLPERKRHRFSTTILWGWATRLMECNNPLLLEVATLWLG